MEPNKKEPVPWQFKPLTLLQKLKALLFGVVALFVMTVLSYYVARLVAFLIIYFRGDEYIY
ncbi:MAG: hypothetical protein JW942_02335 [Opitutales bacterium]|nr:hypothetical protein [Opitutales bacterium]